MADSERGLYSPALLLDFEFKGRPWVAADFSARDAGDALVAGGFLPVLADLATFDYVIVGRFMIVFISITTAPVASAPITLCVAIPEGKVAVNRAGTLAFMADQAARTPAWMEVRAGESFIRFSRLDGAALTNGPSLTLHGQLVFQIR